MKGRQASTMSHKPKQIMILRHAKAEPGTMSGDFTRHLTEVGCDQATLLGEVLRSKKLIPQSVYCSSALRTMETAALVCEQLAIDSADIVAKERLYQASTDTYLQLLRQVNERISRVMLVGHNPVLEALLAALSETPPADRQLHPASMALLTFDGAWQKLSFHHCRHLETIHGKFLTTHKT
jgi:phosphohistidine phosphatase